MADRITFKARGGEEKNTDFGQGETTALATIILSVFAFFVIKLFERE